MIAALLAATFPIEALARRPQHPPLNARLACGQAVFTLRTSEAEALDLAGPAGQSLSVRIDGRERPVRVDMAGQSRVVYDGESRLPAFIGEMTCLAASDGRRYLMLEYACIDAGQVSPPVCHDEREWFRYLDETGHRVDRGYIPQDPRYDALLSRLHLDHATEPAARPTSMSFTGQP